MHSPALYKPSFSRQEQASYALRVEMILKIAGGCCRVLLWGFTCFPLVFHRKRKDAQAGASLQASDHGRQCHLGMTPNEPASASPCQCTSSDPLCLSLPLPYWDCVTRETGETSLNQNPQQILTSPRRRQSIWDSQCLSMAAPWEVPSLLGRSLFC